MLISSIENTLGFYGVKFHRRDPRSHDTNHPKGMLKVTSSDGLLIFIREFDQG